MSRAKIFLDTNILLRHLLQDEPKMAAKATALIESVASKNLTAYVSTLVIHETTYVLEKVYGAKRVNIVKNLIKLLKIENLKVLDIEKESLIAALKDYKKFRVDFPDAVYKQFAVESDLSVATFDNHFTRIKAPLYKL